MPKAKKFIPYGRQSINETDILAVVEALKSPFLTTGPAVDAFEDALRTRLGVSHAVVCMNGTAALHLSAMVLGLGSEDVVIVPAITFLATANGPALTGAKVVFSDVDPKTGLMTGAHLEEALSRAGKVGRPRAVYPVHLNGQCAPMKEISAIARANDLFIVEDACHALGGSVTGPDGDMKSVGSCCWSDMSIFSFHPVKSIAMGEGGAVTCNDPALAEKLFMFRNHGMTRDESKFIQHEAANSEKGEPNPWYYEMHELGHNFRAPDINCALGLSQLNRLDEFIERRCALVSIYDKKIANLSPVVQPIRRATEQFQAWHIYAVQIDFKNAGVSRAHVMGYLREKGIGTQVHYIPVPYQPYWREHADTPPLPGAALYYEQALTLPLFFDMSDEDVDKVISVLTEALRLINHP